MYLVSARDLNEGLGAIKVFLLSGMFSLGYERVSVLQDSIQSTRVHTTAPEYFHLFSIPLQSGTNSKEVKYQKKNNNGVY